MVVLHEMIFYAIHNWGEHTPRSSYDVTGTKDFSIMKDSNIITRDDGIRTYNSENSKSTVGPSINDMISKTLKNL